MAIIDKDILYSPGYFCADGKQLVTNYVFTGTVQVQKNNAGTLTMNSSTIRDNAAWQAGAGIANETGATAIEYGLIAAGISVVIIASVNAIGSKLNTTFQFISDSLK